MTFSRFIFRSYVLLSDALKTLTVTSVPGSPLIISGARSNSSPVNSCPSAPTILSFGNIPAFSAGEPGKTSVTRIVLSFVSNVIWTPIPAYTPLDFSMKLANSSGV